MEVGAGIVPGLAGRCASIFRAQAAQEGFHVASADLVNGGHLRALDAGDDGSGQVAVCRLAQVFDCVAGRCHGIAQSGVELAAQ